MSHVSYDTDAVPVLDGVRFVTQYRLITNYNASEWMNSMLWYAKNEVHLVDEYEVLASYTGIDGLKYILFTFDLAWGNGIDRYTDEGDVLEYATKLITQIVNDDNAQILWAATAQED